MISEIIELIHQSSEQCHFGITIQSQADHDCLESQLERLKIFIQHYCDKTFQQYIRCQKLESQIQQQQEQISKLSKEQRTMKQQITILQTVVHEIGSENNSYKSELQMKDRQISELQTNRKVLDQQLQLRQSLNQSNSQYQTKNPTTTTDKDNSYIGTNTLCVSIAEQLPSDNCLSGQNLRLLMELNEMMNKSILTNSQAFKHNSSYQIHILKSDSTTNTNSMN